MILQNVRPCTTYHTPNQLLSELRYRSGNASTQKDQRQQVRAFNSSLLHPDWSLAMCINNEIHSAKPNLLASAPINPKWMSYTPRHTCVWLSESGGRVSNCSIQRSELLQSLLQRFHATGQKCVSIHPLAKGIVGPGDHTESEEAHNVTAVGEGAESRWAMLVIGVKQGGN